MKNTRIFWVMAATMLLTACANKDVDYDASGVFETTEVIVSARGTGEIVSFNVEEGQTVKAGDTLGELDITQLTATEEQVTTANQSIDGQSAGFDAQIGQIDDQMRQAIITSPIDGTVLSKYAEPGEFAVPGRALFKVADMTDMKLRTYVGAEQLTGLKIGQKVKVYADQGAKGRKEIEGVVSWISSEAEFTPKTIQTRDERSNLVYAVKIAVKNEDGLIKRGMYGDVKF